ncbi:hypothetical protein EVAR_14085_1 [Eumeta japonica]|uniref:Uncharacterized protein n=1 Tax=Eumeta variegata TaxID=151549 RepID=A0A4C1UPL2_EUMVA|nr:hypothetical protein EVAR_14085_1 [Eumeta japonica]
MFYTRLQPSEHPTNSKVRCFRDVTDDCSAIDMTFLMIYNGKGVFLPARFWYAYKPPFPHSQGVDRCASSPRTRSVCLCFKFKACSGQVATTLLSSFPLTLELIY